MTVLTGTEVSDRINGSEFSDLIQGLNGDDWLTGGFGRDSILGGDGDDIIYAGDSNVLDGIVLDDIETEPLTSEYDNFLAGGDGNDLLVGSILDDLQVGGDGNDLLRGLAGDDNLAGNAGNDKIKGNLGDDILLGDSGDDRLFGYQNNDFLDGGSGNDRLYGFNDHHDPFRHNIDSFTGGEGQDIFIFGTQYETYYQLDENNDLGIIKDLNLEDDTIQLHGEFEDYFVVVGHLGEEGISGTYIYYDVYTEGEPIAFVEQHTELDLAADYFDFV